MSSLYREQIMDHYRSPHNEGSLNNATHAREENNPLCGDRQRWYLKMSNVNGQISNVDEARFTGDGCAISIASASMLSDKIKGMSQERIDKLGEVDMFELIGTRVNPGRLKCLMLPLVAVKNALYPPS